MDEFISRDKAIKLLENLGGCDAKDEYSKGYDEAILAAIYDVRVMKPADVQPVKYGKWMNAYTWTMFHEFKSSGRGEHFWCSECEQGQKQKSNYCPNCGADMRGEENDT